MLHHILDNRGNIKELKNIIIPSKPLQMEFNAMSKDLWKKVDYLKTFCKYDFVKLLLGIRPMIGISTNYQKV